LRKEYLVEQDVLRLDVAVDDIAVVHKLDRVAHLPHHVPHPLLSKTAVFPQRSIDVASATGFEKKA
jgi:hypothetical protein